ncbi:hypothetical protein HGRIS_001687 [Hohenbuehelia grisea]|uniref:Uncharacterized protein n=1 Tax=Hohenbuehelia grisea TaxID=104357 RepID=A0ABR3JI58_9AGAR
MLHPIKLMNLLRSLEVPVTHNCVTDVIALLNLANEAGARCLDLRLKVSIGSDDEGEHDSGPAWAALDHALINAQGLELIVTVLYPGPPTDVSNYLPFYVKTSSCRVEEDTNGDTSHDSIVID